MGCWLNCVVKNARQRQVIYIGYSTGGHAHIIHEDIFAYI